MNTVLLMTVRKEEKKGNVWWSDEKDTKERWHRHRRHRRYWVIPKRVSRKAASSRGRRCCQAAVVMNRNVVILGEGGLHWLLSPRGEAVEATPLPSPLGRPQGLWVRRTP